MIFVYAQFRQVADNWAREHDMKPSQVTLISDANPREDFRYEPGDRVIVLGNVKRSTEEHILRMGRKSATVPVEHWEL